jgi:hypothetical protein
MPGERADILARQRERRGHALKILRELRRAARGSIRVMA